jgi:hypothetical protein
MPCLLLILVLAFPRVVLVLVYLLDAPYLTHVYHGLIVPLLGFLFLPLTTLAYAWLVNAHRPLTDGVNVIILIIAVLIDVGGLGGGEWHRRSRW